MRLRILSAVACLGLLVARSWGADIYVNNVTGDDRNDGSAPVAASEQMGPFRTLTRALRATAKGDRLIVANTGQAYRESITLQGSRQSGYPEVVFELHGNGATLDGTEPVPLEGWSFYRGSLFRYRPPRTSFQVLYLDGKPAERHQVSRIEDIDQLQPLQWCLLEQHIYFCVEPGRLPQSYDLSYAAHQVGITLYEVRHVLIRDLVVQGFQLDGINAHDGVTHTTLLGLTCRGNGRSGISIGGASRVRVEACLVGNNGVAQVRTEGYSRAELLGCDLLDNTAPRIVREGGQVVEGP